MENSGDITAENSDQDESTENELETTEKPAERVEYANPDAVPDEMKEMFLVDAVGDTLYSKRFVLSTLLRLNELNDRLSEEFEKDLCTLWDMTIERDVVMLLLEHNVPEIFVNIIQTSEDPRLVEILLGIIGNMCSLAETRDMLCEHADIIVPIIDLLSCSDMLVLVQVMRVLHSCIGFDDHANDNVLWIEHFCAADKLVENFAFILSNSTSTALLFNALKALNAICTKLAMFETQADMANMVRFRNLFVRPILLDGIIEAFRQMLPPRPMEVVEEAPEDGQPAPAIDEEALVPTKKTQRIVNQFLDIIVILSQYEQHSIDCFEPLLEPFYNCISRCLEPLCQSMYLLPLEKNEQMIIGNIDEITQVLNDYFHAKCFGQVITIWSIVERALLEKEHTSNGDTEWDAMDDDAQNDDGEISVSDTRMTLIDFITRTSRRATGDDIKMAVSVVDSQDVVLLCDALSAGASESDIKDCFDKLKEAAESLWDVNITARAVDCDEDGIDD